MKIMNVTDSMIDRAARALTQAKGLWWDRMPKDWHAEIRTQATVALLAAMDTDWNPMEEPDGEAQELRPPTSAG